MRDNPNFPVLSDDASDLAPQLAGAKRYSPAPDFEGRVMAQVRHPLPRWARHMRDYLEGIVSGPRGWVVLGTFSVATATAWTVAIAAGLHWSGYVTEGTRIAVTEAGGPVWREILAGASRAGDALLNSVSGAFASIGISPAALAIGYGAVVVTSAVGFKILTREPTRT